MMYRLLVLLCIWELNGCMTLYAPPTQGPRAFLAVKDTTHMTVSLFNNAVSCKGNPKALYSLFQARGQFVAVPANKLLSLYVVMTSEQSEIPASDTITFVPEAGVKYTVINNPLPPVAPLYRVQIVKELPVKNGQPEYIPIRYIKRSRQFFACNDKELMETLSKITN